MFRSYGAAFATVFLAEMLDKTQFMVLALGARAETTAERLGVFLAASTALVCACGLGVYLSSFIARLEHHQRTFEIAAGGAITLVGLLMLVTALRGPTGS